MATFTPSPDLDPNVARAIQDAVDALRTELLAHLQPETVSPSLGSSGGDRLTRLESAVEALDAATSQTELLACFLEQAGAFADRSLFLVRDGDEFKGWAAFGFAGADGAVGRVSVVGQSEMAAGRPADNPDVSAVICSALDAPQAGESILVPFSLRGKAAGALYADCTTSAGELDRPALRILSYVASQAVETLPLRRGVDEVVEAPVPPADQPEAQEPEVQEAAETVEEVAPGQFDSALSDTDVEVDVERMIEEVEPEAFDEEDETDIVAIRHDVTPSGFDAVSATVDEVADEAADEVDETEVTETLDTGRFDTAIEEIEREERQAHETEAVDELPVDAPTVESDEDVGVEVEPPARVPDGAEVAAPADLDGPGWAFSGSESISDDTRHEEARRLARLLVTEIKLYNEEKVREGRETNDLYDQLRDDIERSRRIYEERIDDEVRDEADYFQEEIVRILAGGDSTALGI